MKGLFSTLETIYKNLKFLIPRANSKDLTNYGKITIDFILNNTTNK